MTYKGILNEKGNRVNEDDAFVYAMWRVFGDPGLRLEFTEWFFSGNWVEEYE